MRVRSRHLSAFALLALLAAACTRVERAQNQRPPPESVHPASLATVWTSVYAAGDLDADGIEDAFIAGSLEPERRKTLGYLVDANDQALRPVELAGAARDAWITAVTEVRFTKWPEARIAIGWQSQMSTEMEATFVYSADGRYLFTLQDAQGASPAGPLVGAGDVDGDGTPDYALGVPSAGAGSIWAVSGEDARVLAVVAFDGAPTAAFGAALWPRRIGERTELLVGAPGARSVFALDFDVGAPRLLLEAGRSFGGSIVATSSNDEFFTTSREGVYRCFHRDGAWQLQPLLPGERPLAYSRLLLVDQAAGPDDALIAFSARIKRVPEIVFWSPSRGVVARVGRPGNALLPSLAAIDASGGGEQEVWCAEQMRITRILPHYVRRPRKASPPRAGRADGGLPGAAARSRAAGWPCGGLPGPLRASRCLQTPR